MIQKIYNFLEGTIALAALVLIIGISTFSVIVMNPSISTDAQNIQPDVAGASTQISGTTHSGTPLLISNIGTNTNDYASQLEALDNNQGYLYTANLTSSNNISSENFIEIYNPTNDSVTLTLSTGFVGEVQDSLKIIASDSTNTIVLYNPENQANTAKLTVPANTKRDLNINYEFLQNINFAFQVKVNLN